MGKTIEESYEIIKYILIIIFIIIFHLVLVKYFNISIGDSLLIIFEILLGLAITGLNSNILKRNIIKLIRVNRVKNKGITILSKTQYKLKMPFKFNKLDEIVNSFNAKDKNSFEIIEKVYLDKNSLKIKLKENYLQNSLDNNEINLIFDQVNIEKGYYFSNFIYLKIKFTSRVMDDLYNAVGLFDTIKVKLMPDISNLTTSQVDRIGKTNLQISSNGLFELNEDKLHFKQPITIEDSNGSFKFNKIKITLNINTLNKELINSFFNYYIEFYLA